MIKINKNFTDLPNLNINSSIYPHPLDSDTYADIEVDWFSWLPGFDSTELMEDDEDPFFRENNIKLYKQIEDLVKDIFTNAFSNMWVLLDSHLINSIFITVDITGILFNSTNSLAGYNFINSKPQKGNYQFDIGQSFLYQILKNIGNDKFSNLKYNTVCEHEIIHLLDHNEILKSSVYSESDNSIIYYKFYLLEYRIEGIAELYYLLKGGIEDTKSISQAKLKFQNNISILKEFILQNELVSFKHKNKDFKTHDFYELGPWLILDMLRYFECGIHEIFINKIIYKIENNEFIEHNEILDVIKIALRIKSEEFINYFN